MVRKLNAYSKSGLRFPSEEDALLSRHKSSSSMAARNSRFHDGNKPWIYSVFVVVIIGLILLLSTSHHNHVTDQKYIIRPGSIFLVLDTDGNPINAHGGGFLFHNNVYVYYWYGEKSRSVTHIYAPRKCRLGWKQGRLDRYILLFVDSRLHSFFWIHFLVLALLDKSASKFLILLYGLYTGLFYDISMRFSFIASILLCISREYLKNNVQHITSSFSHNYIPASHTYFNYNISDFDHFHFCNRYDTTLQDK